MTPGTRVIPTRSNPNRLFAAERARAGVVGNTGSLGRHYSAETAETDQRVSFSGVLAYSRAEVLLSRENACYSMHKTRSTDNSSCTLQQIAPTKQGRMHAQYLKPQLRCTRSGRMREASWTKLKRGGVKVDPG